MFAHKVTINEIAESKKHKTWRINGFTEAFEMKLEIMKKEKK